MRLSTHAIGRRVLLWGVGVVAGLFMAQGHLPFGSEKTIQGEVVAISDGDTLTVLDAGHQKHRIRLWQIDAPEKAQPDGMRSKQSLSDLVYRQQVTVEVADTDRYGRTVGKVIRSDGADINLEQVKRGMAWVYQQYAKDGAYFDAELAAKTNYLGLWAHSSPVPPWEYRKEHRR